MFISLVALPGVALRLLGHAVFLVVHAFVSWRARRNAPPAVWQPGRIAGTFTRGAVPAQGGLACTIASAAFGASPEVARVVVASSADQIRLTLSSEGAPLSVAATSAATREVAIVLPIGIDLAVVKV